MYLNEKNNIWLLTGIFQSAKRQGGQLGFNSRHDLGFLSSPLHSASGSMGTGGRDKVAGEWTDHSPPSSANDENAWFFTSTPPYIITHEA
jgi:hypothetical protein